jgi:SAM-dependent methyltransferase
LKNELERRGVRSGRIVDLGCGSGILAESLSRAGFDVLGIDLSPAMLRIARTRAPGAVFRRGSLHTVPLPKAIAITAVGECLNYLFDERGDDRSIARLFRRIHRALEPDGIFLFDAAKPGRLDGNATRKTHWEGKGWTILVTAAEDRRRKLLVRRITTFRRVGAQYRRDEETHRLRLFPQATIVRLLRNAGFGVDTLGGYAGFRFPAGIVGYRCIARSAPTAPRRRK